MVSLRALFNPIARAFINCVYNGPREAPDQYEQDDFTASYIPVLNGGCAAFLPFLKHHVATAKLYDEQTMENFCSLLNCTEFMFQQTPKAYNPASPNYNRFGCPVHAYPSSPNGSAPICEDTPANRYNIAVLYTAILNFLIINFGVLPEDIPLIKFHFLLYIAGGGIGSHNDWPNSVNKAKHKVRLNIRLGAAQDVTFTLRYLYDGDTSLSVLPGAADYKHTLPGMDGMFVYAMSHFAQGALPLCLDGDAYNEDESLKWIAVEHEVECLKTGRALCLIVDFPLPSLEAVNACLCKIRKETFSLDFSDARYGHLLFTKESMAVSNDYDVYCASVSGNCN
jgi:hypothetical protein